MAPSVSSYVQSAAIGVGCGAASFVANTTFQKVCMLAGIKFEEWEDSDSIPSSERLDAYFKEAVIIFPIAEELIFRGALQPIISAAFNRCFSSNRSAYVGIPVAKITSSVITGSIFGSLHCFAYEKGGVPVAVAGSVTGTFFGLVKEKHGLTASIAAHITHNLCTGLLDKHFPSFLESALDRKLRNKG